jgi:hypothetical protein
VKGVVLHAIEIDLPEDDTCVRGGIPNNRELIGRSGNGDPAVRPVGVRQPHCYSSPFGLGATGQAPRGGVLTRGGCSCLSGVRI